LIAGVTEKIHVMESQFSGMGQRTLNYSLPEQDRIKTTHRASQIASAIKEHREMLKIEFTEYINTILPQMSSVDSELPPEVSFNIVLVSNFATLARSPVEKTWKGDVDLVLAPEMPMRMSNQLHLLAKVFMTMSGGTLTKDYEKILYKIAMDSIPKGRRMALKELSHYNNVTTKGMATKLGYPTGSVKTWLEEINALKICDRDTGGGSKGDKWTIKASFREMMKIFDHIEKVDEDLKEDDVFVDDDKAFAEFDMSKVEDVIKSSEWKDL